MTMLRKKNYKDEDHFTQLHSFTAIAPSTPESPPRKFQIYYKRYRPASSAKINIYNLANQKGKQEEIEPTPAEYPVDRTLELICFDGNLFFLKKYLRKIGKIRKY